MAGHGEKLGRKQEQAIAALLARPTIGEAAISAGVSERSLKGWLTQPAFLAAYRQARRAIVEAAVTRLQKSADKAAEALERNLVCGRPADEIRAAAILLDHALHGLEVGDVLQRLDELEALIKKEGKADDAQGDEPAGEADESKA